MSDQLPKPPCPECNSSRIAPILYGLPDAEAGMEADRGEVWLEGCCISGNDPQWHCLDCEHEWGE